MPMYTVCNTVTGEEKDDFFPSHDALETWLAENPDYERRFKGVAIVSGVGGIKVSDGFNDILKGAKKYAGRHSTVNTK